MIDRKRLILLLIVLALSFSSCSRSHHCSGAEPWTDTWCEEHLGGSL